MFLPFLSPLVFFSQRGKKAGLTKRYIAMELLRSMIDHKKVLILALNGPAVGGGAAWFPGIADIVLASNTAWLQCPFSVRANYTQKTTRTYSTVLTDT